MLKVRVQGTSPNQREDVVWNGIRRLTSVMFEVPIQDVEFMFEDGPVGDIGLFVEGQKAANVTPETKKVYKEKAREVLTPLDVSVSVVCKAA